MDKAFQAKVMALVGVTQRLDIPNTLLVRRMTLQDPESQKWATTAQLKLIFNVILEAALRRAGSDALATASSQMFDSIIPPGPEELCEEERWLLFDLSKPFLDDQDSATSSDEEVTEAATQAVMMDIPTELQPRQLIQSADFAVLFDETLAQHFRRVLQVICTTNTRPYIPTPFYLAPSFIPCFESFLRAHVLPRVRKTKAVRELAKARDWSDKSASSRLLATAHLTDNNPIQPEWELRWHYMHPDHAPKRRDAKSDELEIDPNELWEILRQDAAQNGYAAPEVADLPLIKLFLPLHAEVLDRHWKTITQIYQQEFHPTSRENQGRANSFRDSLLRSFDKVKHHGGELLAIKAFFDLPKADRGFLQQLVKSTGRGQSEQRRKVPYLMDFLERLPK